MNWLDKVIEWWTTTTYPESYPTLNMRAMLDHDLDKADWYYSIDGSNSAILNFDKEDWAPGLWAGTEGYKFTKGRRIYTITTVDLDNMVLHVKEKK